MEQVNEKMLGYLNTLVFKGTVRNEKHFCDLVGLSQSHLWAIRNNGRHFTVMHIRRACLLFDIDPNDLLCLNLEVTNEVTKH